MKMNEFNDQFLISAKLKLVVVDLEDTLLGIFVDRQAVLPQGRIDPSNCLHPAATNQRNNVSCHNAPLISRQNSL
jgi:hypothetical protein